MRSSRLVQVLGWALVCFSLPQVAAAVDGIWSRAGGWQVSWTDDAIGCTAMNVSDDREAIYLSVTNKGSQLVFINPSWTFIQSGEKYPLGLLFDSRHYWGGDSVGLKSGGMIGLRAGVSSDLLKDFAKKRRVRLFVNGEKKPSATYSLTGSFRALNETIECAEARKRGGLQNL